MVIGVVIVLLVMVVGLSVVVYQLFMQQARLVLRLDAVEKVQGSHSVPVAAPAVRPGVAVGRAVEAFSLVDTFGHEVALADFEGQRLVLVHWSPGCGFCEKIAAELAGLQPQLAARRIGLVLVAHGGAEANIALAERHQLHCPILLTDEAQVPDLFANLGTPAAYLLDAEGRVAKSVAIGADEVPRLVREAASVTPKALRGQRSVSESRLVRDGLKKGTPAPGFRLPDLSGREVALEDYRGRRVLLVFSDPHCGPCDALAPHLAALHRSHLGGGLATLMVTRGELEENRAKASQRGLEFPIVIQPGWTLSRDYGIFATPVAFLIDPDGIIEADVAQGVEAIVALALEPATSNRGP